jgi:hypothetical protein
MAMAGEKYGRALLEKMGWKAGTGLGAKRDGCIEPLAVKSRPEKLGVGAERRDFRDAWWEKAFEDAYGKGTDRAGDENLLRACEGRRCRPHGAAKLARLAKQDSSAKAISAREISPCSLSSDGTDDKTNLRAFENSVHCVLKESRIHDDSKVRTKRKRQEEQGSIVLECTSLVDQSSVDCSTSDRKISGGVEERVGNSMHRRLKMKTEKQAKKTKRARQGQRKTEDKSTGFARLRKDSTERSGWKESEPLSPSEDLKVSTGRVRKHSRKP